MKLKQTNRNEFPMNNLSTLREKENPGTQNLTTCPQS